MSTEYGVFNAEGMLEGDLWSEDQAMSSLVEFYTEGEQDLYVAEVCGNCRGGEYGYCGCEDEEES